MSSMTLWFPMMNVASGDVCYLPYMHVRMYQNKYEDKRKHVSGLLPNVLRSMWKASNSIDDHNPIEPSFSQQQQKDSLTARKPSRAIFIYSLLNHILFHSCTSRKSLIKHNDDYLLHAWHTYCKKQLQQAAIKDSRMYVDFVGEYKT